MEATPTEVLAAFLVAQGFATRPQPPGGVWPVVKGKMPNTPEEIIAIYDTSPDQFGKDMRGEDDGIVPTCQIRTRSSYNKAYVKLRLIAKALSEIGKVPGGGIVVTAKLDGGGTEQIKITNVTIDSGPLHIGQEETNNLENFTLNVQVSCEEV